MSRKRLSMMIQEEIKRLKELGHSQRKTAKILGIDRGTVGRYWNSAPEFLHNNKPQWVKDIDWDYITEELKTVPIKILYEELSDSIKLPSYQAFCSYLKRNKQEPSTDVTIRIDRTPGASIEVDYSGDSMQILNPATGELYSVELFLGTLSYSGKIYAEFTLSQKLEDFIRAHNNMFFYFGGVTSYIIPDNCKTAVLKADKFDPFVHPTYHDMCKHYAIAVDPADSASPKHKPNVERAVGYLQTDFLPRMRKKTFTSLFELNRELKNWIVKANEKVIQGRGHSRNYFFEKEKSKLRKLPDSFYELFYFKKAKVHPDCHFQHEKNFYSVPYQYVGKEIDIKFNKDLVYAFYKCDRIATHKTSSGTYHWSTNNNHYPEQKYIEFNYHLAQIKKDAKKVGENTLLLVERLIAQAKYPLKIIRKARGILNLEKRFGAEVLNYACGEALDFDKLNIDNIKRFAKYYKHKPKEQMNAPIRDIELICLQGGLHE